MHTDPSRILATHEAFRSASTGPAWLAERQDAGLKRFLGTGFPSLHDENWRYTNLRALRDACLTAATGETDTLTAADLTGNTWSLTLTPGKPYEVATAPPDGVHVFALTNALAGAEGEAIRAALGQAVGASADAMTAFNDAFAEDAIVIRITRGVEVAETIQINWLCTGGDDSLASPRLLIHAEAMSRVTVVENRVVTGGYCNGVSELLLDEGANLQFVDLKRDRGQSHSIGSVFANIGRDAQLTALSMALGGRLVRNDLTARLLAPGAHVDLQGVYIAARGEHIDNHTCVDHLSPLTHSVEHYRGIIAKMGHAVFNGKVVVHRDAQQTSSAQNNDNILLDDSAEIDTKPELQIYADDVRCSHGATVGRLDDDALFYLRSRGIDPDGARAMLLDAFARRSLQAITDSSLRASLTALVGDFLTRTISGAGS